MKFLTFPSICILTLLHLPLYSQKRNINNKKVKWGGSENCFLHEFF